MTDNLKWIKASYSGAQGGNCIEVAGHDSRVLVRDTKHRTGPTLRFTADAWKAFADHVKADASLRLTLGPRFRGALPCLGALLLLCSESCVRAILSGISPKRVYPSGFADVR